MRKAFFVLLVCCCCVTTLGISDRELSAAENNQANTRWHAGEKCSSVSPGSKTVDLDNVVAICISDFHIGERYGGATMNPGQPGEYCRFNPDKKNSQYVRTEFIKFLKLVKASTKQQGKKIPYLIILGDMWDLAMNAQEDTFAVSFNLFRELNESGEGIGLADLFERVIYAPGNHDHHLWQMLQEKYWVADRLERGVAPLVMPREYALTLDLETGSLTRDGSSDKPGEISSYNLVSRLLGLGEETPVYVAYPNVFIRKSGNEYILLTHGHFFEPNWNIVTMVFSDLFEKSGIPMTIHNMEMFNAITTEWHSYSLSQTPPYQFWESVYDRHFNKRPATDWQKTMQEIIKAHFSVRDVEGDPKTPSQKQHDIEALCMQRKLVEHYLGQAEPDGGKITSMIYGHTHIPTFGETELRCGEAYYPSIEIYNTGGWVDINPKEYREPKPMLIFKDGNITPL